MVLSLGITVNYKRCRFCWDFRIDWLTGKKYFDKIRLGRMSGNNGESWKVKVCRGQPEWKFSKWKFSTPPPPPPHRAIPKWQLKVCGWVGEPFASPLRNISPIGQTHLPSPTRKTRKRFEKFSKLGMKTPERRQWRRSCVFAVNLEHISPFFF